MWGAPPLVYTGWMQRIHPTQIHRGLQRWLPPSAPAHSGRRSIGALSTLCLLLSVVCADAQTGADRGKAAAKPDGTVAHPFTELEDGKAAARTEKKPLLVLFGTEDCAFTKLFYEKTVPDPSVQRAFSELVFTSIDVSGGKGKFIGMMHEAQATPTFVLYDPDRGPLHQWKGWGQVAFLQNLGGAIRSNTLVVDRLTRYATAPTAEDAALLGFFHASTGKFSSALPEFRKAEELNPEFDFAAEKFDAAASGYVSRQLDFEDLRKSADEIVRKASSAEEVVNVAAVMINVTERMDAGEQAKPYLSAALERAAGTDRADILDALWRLEPYRLLYIENDPDAALLSYQKSFPGWPTDPDALNNVAWWCLSHDIRLERAEGWAREAVANYANTKDRANARDTLADILVRQGKKDEAIEQLFKAFEEAPEVTSYGFKLRDLGAEVKESEPKRRVTINGVEEGSKDGEGSQP